MHRVIQQLAPHLMLATQHKLFDNGDTEIAHREDRLAERRDEMAKAKRRAKNKAVRKQRKRSK